MILGMQILLCQFCVLIVFGGGHAIKGQFWNYCENLKHWFYSSFRNGVQVLVHFDTTGLSSDITQYTLSCKIGWGGNHFRIENSCFRELMFLCSGSFKPTVWREEADRLWDFIDYLKLCYKTEKKVNADLFSLYTHWLILWRVCGQNQ